MGSYINIGFASNKDDIKESVMTLLKSLTDFKFAKIVFPKNNDYSDWQFSNNLECSIDKALDYCLKYEMSYFLGSFRLKECLLANVSFSVERNKDNCVCFIIKVPDDLLLNNIDEIEFGIVELMRKTKGFDFAFCDNEAHLDDEKYSIYVQYLKEPCFVYNDWKIDGFTKR